MADRSVVVIEVDSRIHHPTEESRDLVMKMVACGLDIPQIAWVLHCRPEEVKYCYRDELYHAVAITNAEVGAAVLRAAKKGDINAAKFWLQSRAKWIVPTREYADSGKPEVQSIRERRALLDDIVRMMAPGKDIESAAETVARSNPGAKSVN